MESDLYKLRYIYKTKDKALYIFGKKFVENNKNKEKIIFGNKKYKLKEFINIENIKEKKEIKIKLILSKNCQNKSFMFANRKSLTRIEDDKSKIEYDNIKEDKENHIGIDTKLFSSFSSYNESYEDSLSLCESTVFLTNQDENNDTNLIEEITKKI